MARPSKCKGQMAIRGDRGRMQHSWEGDGVEEVLIPHNGKLIRIAMYEGDVSVLTLGEMNNPALA